MNSHAVAAMMPALFISHGSPMVAIQRGPYQDALAKFGREVRPRDRRDLGALGQRHDDRDHWFRAA